MEEMKPGVYDARVLYVDDEDSARDSVASMLLRRFKEVFVAKNGLEAIKIYREKTPDLVVSDIRMPSMTGIELAKEIRIINSDVPIIIVTAYDETAYLHEAIELGISDYVLKPITKEKLFQAIERALNVIILKRKVEKYNLEREKLISELKEALANARTLSGLIPICSSCKKIRNDKGYWQEVEKYMAEHSDAEFTHSVCPDCKKKLYPDYE